jgi:hypothetical protein
MPQRPKHLKKSNDFPNLAKRSNKVTSDKDPDYNCIAFAAGITNRKLWPNFLPDYTWPAGIPRSETLDSFERLFESFGYVRCADGSYQDGIEKVAIYTSVVGRPTHAARQVNRGMWASKLGNWYDIEHIEKAVSGGSYGEISLFMQRNKP